MQPPAAAPPLLFRSPLFSPADAGASLLRLFVGPDALHYVVLSEAGEPLLLSAHAPDAGRAASMGDLLDRALFSDTELKLPFGRVEVVLAAPRWVLVPADAAFEGAEAALLRTQHDVADATDKVFRDGLKAMGLTVAFALDDIFIKKLDFYFKTYALRHLLSALLPDTLRAQQELATPYVAQLHLLPRGLMLAVLRGRTLLLANEFAALAAEDALYYVVQTLKALGVPDAEAAVFVTGQAPWKAGLLRLLPGFFRRHAAGSQLYPKRGALQAADFAAEDFSHLLAPAS